MAEIDYSTLNVEELRALPEATLAAGAHYSDSRGSGCAFDPPGYPSHYLQNVYNAHGNNVSRGSETVIFHPDVGYREISNARGPYPRDLAPLLRRLWVPLPMSHPRVQGWFAHTAGYLRGTDKDGPWQRGFYPEYTGDGITPVYGKGSMGDWVNLFAEAPRDGTECVRQQRLKYGVNSVYWNRHPLNNTWCQHCGWVEPTTLTEQAAARMLSAAAQQLTPPKEGHHDSED